MYWKMSIDLSRPAVSSMGNLDPYDGLVICTLLQQAADKTCGVQGGFQGQQGSDAGRRDQASAGRVLQAEIDDLQTMVDVRYRR